MPCGPADGVAFRPAAELVTEAKTVLALKAACRRLSEHDASRWLWDEEGIRFCIAEAREEAKSNPEGAFGR